MLDDALEPVGPIALDPVHHIAAIGAAERAGIAGVELRIERGGRGEAGLEVLERLAAPVAVDAVGEGLAVAGRAVEIDRHPAVIGGGEQFGVPRRGPAVAERARRPAMDEQRDGEPAGGALALDDLAPDLIAIGAGEME